MGGTANKSTPRIPLCEALKRAGSFDALRQYLHTGRIPAHHGGLYTFSDSKMHSGPGDIKPEWWAHAHQDRVGRRVIFFHEELVFGCLVRADVFAYDISIELDSAAFDMFFPVADLPPAEQKLMETADWFRKALKDHPRQPKEKASDYATRLQGHMKTAPVTRQWTLKTLYRRLYE